MNHADHVKLLQKAVTPGGKWAELGSGTGAFTLALRDIGGKNMRIYSVDKDKSSLDLQKERMDEQFPRTHIQYILGNFTRKLSFFQLDGVVMANSLHFIENKTPVLRLIKTYLKDQGKLVLVEYNVDKGNFWVPYPFSYITLEKLASELGFKSVELLETVPSQFLDEIYSAVLTV